MPSSDDPEPPEAEVDEEALAAEDRKIVETFTLIQILEASTMISLTYGPRIIEARKAHPCTHCDAGENFDCRLDENLFIQDRLREDQGLPARKYDIPDFVYEASLAIQKGDRYVGDGAGWAQSHWCIRCTVAGVVPGVVVLPNEDPQVRRVREALDREMRRASDKMAEMYPPLPVDH